MLARCFAYQFNIDYQITLLLVLWAAGWAMITLAALVHLPVSVVTAIGALLIAGHNLFDSVRWANPLWTILHRQGAVLSGDHVVFVAYPLIPWIGVTAVGYGLGHLYSWTTDERRALLLRLGLATSLAFVLIRGINAYGDPAPWMPQPTALFTALSFLNATKQPPSLLYLLMTLGPALLALWAVDGRTPRMLRPALTFGRVPLFYYLTHFAWLHVTCRGRLLPALRNRTLDVRIARPPTLPIQPTARLGIHAACGVPLVGVSGARDVSALRVVRTAQATAERRVAQLLLNRSCGYEPHRSAARQRCG